MPSLNDITNNIQKKYDELSTSVYKTCREIKEKYEDNITGKTAAKKEMDQKESKNKNMQNKLDNFGKSGIDKNKDELLEYSDIEQGEVFVDTARDTFDEIGEFQSPVIKERKKASEQIMSWLRKEDEKGYLDKKNIEYDKERINLSILFKNKFDEDKLKFGEINLLFKNGKVKDSNDTISRFTQINDIIDSFTGNEISMQNINSDFNLDFSERVINVIKGNIEGKLSDEITGQKLFLETHGINNEKITKTLDNEEIANLCVMQEIGIEAEQFVGLSKSQLKVISDAARNGESFENTDFVCKFYINESIDKTREEKNSQIIDLEQNGDVEKTMLFEHVPDSNNVRIYNESYKGEELLAEQTESGEFIQGSMYNIINHYSKSDKVQMTLDGREENDLQQIISMHKQAQIYEAAMNPMSFAEKQIYEKEQEDAINQMRRAGNPFFNN